MTPRTNSRRNFFKLPATGAPGSTLGWNAAGYARVLGANDRIGVGIIGFFERAMETLIPTPECDLARTERTSLAS